MKFHFVLTCLTLAVLGAAPLAWAEKADSDKPMHIEADALKHDQVDVIAGDAAAIEALGTKLSGGGHYFIYAPELAKTPQGFLIAPTVSKAIDSALDDAVVSIETERFQDPKP